MGKSNHMSRRRKSGASNSKIRVNAPLSTGVQMRNSNGLDTIVFRGTEYVTTSGFTTAAAAGALWLDVLVNPTTLSASRLAAESTLWSQFRFTKLKFHFDSSAPLTFGGQIGIGITPEVELSLTGGNSAVAYLLDLPGATTTNVWASSFVEFNCSSKLRQIPWYYTAITDQEQSLVSQARLFGLVIQPLTNVTAGTSTFYTIRIEYVCEFSRKKLAQPSQYSNAYFPMGTNYSIAASGQFSSGTVNIINGQIYRIVAGEGLIDQGLGLSGTPGDYTVAIPGKGQFIASSIEECHALFQSASPQSSCVGNTNTYPASEQITWAWIESA